MTVLDTYSHLVFTCFTGSLHDVSLAASEELLDSTDNWSAKRWTAPVDLHAIYADEPLPGCRYASKVMFFSPRAAPQSTVMFANGADGWLTLANCLSNRMPQCNVYLFRISSPRRDWPAYSFDLLRGRESVRHISVLKDVDRWKFWQEGEPHPEEHLAEYAKRRVKDRLSREYLVSLAGRLGFPVHDDEFWQSDSKAVYFEEQPSWL